MGLDCYLRRGKKIPKISWEEYKQIERKISNKEDDYKALIKKYKEYVKECGTYHHWNSLLEEVGYWRKANQIHKFFVDNVQNGTDDCDMYLVNKEDLEELLDRVNKVLENSELVEGKVSSGYSFEKQEDGEIIRLDHYKNGKVIKDTSVAEELLPTQCGFFFGGNEYDEYYYNDLTQTKRIIEDVLDKTDFDNEYIVYESSW